MKGSISIRILLEILILVLVILVVIVLANYASQHNIFSVEEVENFTANLT